jgi:hypothetical protein
MQQINEPKIYNWDELIEALEKIHQTGGVNSNRSQKYKLKKQTGGVNSNRKTSQKYKLKKQTGGVNLSNLSKIIKKVMARNKVLPVLNPNNPNDPPLLNTLQSISDSSNRTFNTIVYNINPATGKTDHLQGVKNPVINRPQDDGIDIARKAMSIVLNNNKICKPANIALISKAFSQTVRHHTTVIADQIIDDQQLQKVRFLINYIQTIATLAFRSPLETHVFIDFKNIYLLQKLLIICEKRKYNTDMDRHIKISLNENIIFHLTLKKIDDNDKLLLSKFFNYITCDIEQRLKDQFFLDYFTIKQAEVRTITKNLADLTTSLIKFTVNKKILRYIQYIHNKNNDIKQLLGLYAAEEERIRKLNEEEDQYQYLKAISDIEFDPINLAHNTYKTRLKESITSINDTQLNGVEQQFLYYYNETLENDPTLQQLYVFLFTKWLNQVLENGTVVQPKEVVDIWNTKSKQMKDPIKFENSEEVPTSEAVKLNDTINVIFQKLFTEKKWEDTWESTEMYTFKKSKIRLLVVPSANMLYELYIDTYPTDEEEKAIENGLKNTRILIPRAIGNPPQIVGP